MDRRALSLLLSPLLLLGCDRPEPIDPVATVVPIADATAAEPASAPPGTPAAQVDGASGPAELQPPPLEPVAGAAPVTARALLRATSGSQVSGELTFSLDAGAVKLAGRIDGLTPNAEHGFHVHQNGDCSAPDATTAGEHFNPSGAPHGQAGSGPHHAGDLHNVRADANGVATVDQRVAGLELGSRGPRDAIGRALIVHEKRDDYTTQPSGGAGARIACAVIQQM